MGIPADTQDESRKRTQPLRSAVALVVIALVIAAALAAVDSVTREQVRRNEQSWILERLDALVPPAEHDNDLLADSLLVTSPDLLGTPGRIAIYRARKQGRPVAAIVHTIAPNGYRGPIELLVAIAADGSLLGVQVIHHNETPGLGDAFEHDGGRWLDRFRGRSLTDPIQPRWSVRKDGGDFDAFTGATITPRAIVKAVRQSLEYFRANQRQIFESPAATANR
jgi:electron transport complex protein RnfG